jgi:hypothetical protein
MFWTRERRYCSSDDHKSNKSLFSLGAPTVNWIVVLANAGEKTFWVIRTDGLGYAAQPVNADECPRREYGNVRLGVCD